MDKWKKRKNIQIVMCFFLVQIAIIIIYSWSKHAFSSGLYINEDDGYHILPFGDDKISNLANEYIRKTLILSSTVLVFGVNEDSTRYFSTANDILFVEFDPQKIIKYPINCDHCVISYNREMTASWVRYDNRLMPIKTNDHNFKSDKVADPFIYKDWDFILINEPREVKAKKLEVLKYIETTARIVNNYDIREICIHASKAYIDLFHQHEVFHMNNFDGCIIHPHHPYHLCCIQV